MFLAQHVICLYWVGTARPAPSWMFVRPTILPMIFRRREGAGRRDLFCPIIARLSLELDILTGENVCPLRRDATLYTSGETPDTTLNRCQRRPCFCLFQAQNRYPPAASKRFDFVGCCWHELIYVNERIFECRRKNQLN